MSTMITKDTSGRAVFESPLFGSLEVIADRIVVLKQDVGYLRHDVERARMIIGAVTKDLKAVLKVLGKETGAIEQSLFGGM